MTDNLLVEVHHRQSHARGTRVAGVGGRLYYVNAESGVLHAEVSGIVSAQSGCHPDCAARFAQFPDTFRRVRSHTPPPPPSTPSPPSAVAPAGGGPAALSADELAVLDESVSRLRAALESGDHDDYLESLLAAEEAGKTRKSAVAAIRDRIAGLED